MVNPVNKQLEKAFAEAAKLPPEEQDALARWLLAELAAERSWDDSLSRSREKLRGLAADAVREHREGRTRPLDPEKL